MTYQALDPVARPIDPICRLEAWHRLVDKVRQQKSEASKQDLLEIEGHSQSFGIEVASSCDSIVLFQQKRERQVDSFFSVLGGTHSLNSAEGQQGKDMEILLLRDKLLLPLLKPSSSSTHKIFPILTLRHTSLKPPSIASPALKILTPHILPSNETPL